MTSIKFRIQLLILSLLSLAAVFTANGQRTAGIALAAVAFLIVWAWETR